MSKGGE